MGNLSNTEERISSQRIKTVIKSINGNADARVLSDEAEKCGKKDVLGLCTFHVKDRKDRMCEYCEVNI